MVHWWVWRTKNPICTAKHFKGTMEIKVFRRWKSGTWMKTTYGSVTMEKSKLWNIWRVSKWYKKLLSSMCNISVCRWISNNWMWDMASASVVGFFWTSLSANSSIFSGISWLENTDSKCSNSGCATVSPKKSCNKKFFRIHGMPFRHLWTPIATWNTVTWHNSSGRWLNEM